MSKCFIYQVPIITQGYPVQHKKAALALHSIYIVFILVRTALSHLQYDRQALLEVRSPLDTFWTFLNLPECVLQFLCPATVVCLRNATSKCASILCRSQTRYCNSVIKCTNYIHALTSSGTLRTAGCWHLLRPMESQRRRSLHYG